MMTGTTSNLYNFSCYNKVRIGLALHASKPLAFWRNLSAMYVGISHSSLCNLPLYAKYQY